MSADPTVGNAEQIEMRWSSQRLPVHDLIEDWTGVTSPVERRKLQNRLNQRARRMRFREKAALQLEDPVNSTVSTIRGSNMIEDSDNSTTSDIAISKFKCMQSSPRVQELMARFAEHAHASYMQRTPSLTHLNLLVKYNVYSALAHNANLLDVTAEYFDWNGISPFNKHGPLLDIDMQQRFANRPANLHPTTLQLQVEHHPWVDLFPWPRLRDNMLQAFAFPEICDEDELCQDVCDLNDPNNKPTLIIWGSPWDPRSWEVTTEFLRKWGWLLNGCTGVVEAANYWRAKRGERLISPKQFEDAIRNSMPRLSSMMGVSSLHEQSTVLATRMM